MKWAQRKNRVDSFRRDPSRLGVLMVRYQAELVRFQRFLSSSSR
jgi:hypothetical protein